MISLNYNLSTSGPSSDGDTTAAALVAEPRICVEGVMEGRLKSYLVVGFCRVGLVALLTFMAVLGFAGPPGTATAATLTVSACNQGSLDAAVATANADNAGDTVVFSCSGTITITSTLNITGSMTIDGSGQNVVLDGGSAAQIFLVQSGIVGLTDLTLEHASAGFAGGALENAGGAVTITGCTFANNAASAFGAAIYNTLGSVAGSIMIIGSTFTDNVAQDGSAVYSNVGVLTINTSTFSGNSASGDGLRGRGERLLGGDRKHYRQHVQRQPQRIRGRRALLRLRNYSDRAEQHLLGQLLRGRRSDLRQWRGRSASLDVSHSTFVGDYG